jgi:hypothetical protein
MIAAIKLDCLREVLKARVNCVGPGQSHRTSDGS